MILAKMHFNWKKIPLQLNRWYVDQGILSWFFLIPTRFEALLNILIPFCVHTKVWGDIQLICNVSW